LHAEITTYTLACIFDGGGGDLHAAAPGEANATVAQVFAANEHKGEEDDDDEGCGDGMDQRCEGSVCEIEDGLFRLFEANGDGLVCFGGELILVFYVFGVSDGDIGRG
jgi:hypothetical protein